MVEIGKETDRPHGSRPACRAGGQINRGIHVDYGVRQVPDGFRGKRSIERLARQLVRHSRVDAVDVLACGPPRHPHVFDGERVVVEAVELGAKRFEPLGIVDMIRPTVLADARSAPASAMACSLAPIRAKSALCSFVAWDTGSLLLMTKPS